MNNTDLIWRNLSDFWGRIPESDKDVINKLWEGWQQSLDAEYNQLYQIDLAKSLETCPVFSKYRWCLLDLTKKNLTRIKDEIASVKRESSVTQLKTSAVNNELLSTNHVDHRHFFIRPKNFQEEIFLPFGLEPALVEGFRLYNSNVHSGLELSYGNDYLVNSNSIKLGLTINNQTDVGFYVGINETNLDVNNFWYRHTEVVLSPKSTFILPNNYDDTIGIMVFVDGRYLNQNEITLDTANTVTTNIPVTGTIEFIWYVKDVNAEFNLFHEHDQQSFIFNPDSISGTGVAGSISFLSLNPPQGLSADVRYSGPESKIRLFVRGKFYPDDLWSYDPGTGIILFNTPISWLNTEFVPISVEFVNSQNQEFDSSHLHIISQFANVIVTLQLSTFDDGGRFDDGGIFDSVEEENQFDLPYQIEDTSSLRIFYNGSYLYSQYDYILLANKKTVAFKFPISGGSLRFEYERDSGRFTYGASDLDGLTQDQIRKINLLLFYNEDLELMSEFNTDSPEESTKSSDAYKLASQDIYCVSIPVLQTKVDNPDIKYYEKTLTNKGQYKIVNGGLECSLSLEEYLWCPVVYFDESFLAKNFGAFVDFLKKESSDAYKQALQAIWSGLWNGPIIENAEWIVSMFLNIPYIPESGKIVKISKKLDYTEILTSIDKYYLDGSKNTELSVGDLIYLGQSLEKKNKLNGETSFSSIGEIGSTRLEIPSITLSANIGNLITITSGAATGTYKVIRTDDNAVIINKPLTGYVGLIQDDVFDNTVSYDSLMKSILWTQFNTKIEVGSYIYFPDAYASVKVIGRTDTSIKLEYDPPIAIADGVKFYVYNKNTFAVIEAGTSPFVKRDATITAINKAYTYTILMDNGKSVSVPSNFDLDVAEGQSVDKFQPVSNQVALYDDTQRKDWLYEKNSAFNAEIASGGDDVVDRIIDSKCSISGFWITDNSLDFIGKVKAGDTINISSGPNANISYTVKLVKNNKLMISNELVNDSEATYSIDHVIKVTGSDSLERITSVSNPVTVTLLDSITPSTVNIRVSNIENLPNSGVLKAVLGDNVELIFYGYKINNELRDCVRLFNNLSGNQALALPVNHSLNLVFEINEQLIREVFYSAMRAISSIVDNAYITEHAIDLYNITKNNITIVEMFAESSVNQPDILNLSNFMNKIIPSSSFWFIDINKGLSDVDEREPEEDAVLALNHFNCIKLSEINTYTNTGIISTSSLVISSSIGISVGDYVYIPSFTLKYAKITSISVNTLTLDRLLDPTAIVPIQVLSAINQGTCELDGINAIFSVDPGIQFGCTLTVIDGINVGTYNVDVVTGNKIFILGKNFIESGNSIKYNFYVTSSEGNIL
jgi:hypothetical protein